MTGYYDHNGVSRSALSYVFNDKTYASGSNQQGICLPSTANPACPGGAYLFGAAYGQMDISSSSASLQPVRRNADRSGSHLRCPERVPTPSCISYFNFPNAIHSYYNQGQIFMFGLRGTW